MTLPIRFTLVALTCLLAVAASAMLPSSPSDVAGIDTVIDPIPPLHMAVPTVPYTG